MGIFNRHYERPGPGVRKDEPKKKGLRRFFEIFLLEFLSLVKLNILFCLSALPSAALFVFGLFGTGGTLMILLSVPAAFPIGGAITSCVFCIVKMLRDDPGYAFYEFWRKFKENVLQSAVPGIFYTAFVYIQLYFWIGMSVGEIEISFGTMTLLIVSATFFEMIIPYVFLQTAYVALKNPAIMKNSVLIAIKNAPKSFCGMILGRSFWIASLLFFPLSMWWAPFLLMFGFTLSWLINLMWIWPAADGIFSIDKALKAVQLQKTEDILPIFTSREPPEKHILGNRRR